MNARCADCANGMDHCHGALVEHVDGPVECTDATCVDADARRHPLRVSCADVSSECPCQVWSLPQVYSVAS